MIVKPASRLGEVKEYYFSKKLREIRTMIADGKPVLNLGIGSPDLAPSEDVIQELINQSQYYGNHAYQSYKGIEGLRKAFAQWYLDWFEVELDPDKEILPLIGSKEGIMHISMAFLDAADEVLIPNPGYPAYGAVAKLTGASLRTYDLLPENDWLPDLEYLGQQDLSKVKIMWINYPNMPTGAKASQTFFEQIIDFANQHKILICNDNPYAFILNDNPQSILNVENAKEVAIELNSLSKAHNMAGWRVGMLAGKDSYIDQILRFKTNMDSGMFKPVQMAAIKALGQPKEWYENLNGIYLNRRNYVYELLDALGCDFATDQFGMFVWARTPNSIGDGYELSDKVLYDKHVFITPGGIFGSRGDNYIRVSLCNEVEVFQEAINRIKH